LLDIDAFATITDRHGTHKGNQVIREMSDMIQNAANKQDLLSASGVEVSPGSAGEKQT
jgi:GGDEF domain-containing protein